MAKAEMYTIRISLRNLSQDEADTEKRGVRKRNQTDYKVWLLDQALPETAPLD